MSGWQVARAVKQIAPQVPVFLVTGFGVELSAEERRAHGVDLVLVKPLQIQEILDAVAEVARSHPRLIVTRHAAPEESAMAYKNLTVERANQVATLTLNRPDAYNALNLRARPRAVRRRRSSWTTTPTCAASSSPAPAGRSARAAT